MCAVMEIFGVGGVEFLLIIIIAMVVAGPKRVVQWAYYVGKFFARVRKIWGEMMTVIQKEMNEAGMNIELPKTPPTRQSISQATRDMLKPYTKELDEAQKDIERNLENVQRELSIKQNVMLSSQIKPKPTEASQNGDTPPTTESPTTFGTWSMPNSTEESPSNEPK